MTGLLPSELPVTTTILNPDLIITQRDGDVVVQGITKENLEASLNVVPEALIDGNLYGRKDAAWQLAADNIISSYLDGMSEQQQSLTVEVSGTSVYLDIEAVGGGDITYWLSGTQYTLDCTTGSGIDGKARVELPQGTAIMINPSIVYVAYSEQLDKLELFTTGPESPPDSGYAPVAIMGIQDYATVTSEGPKVFQRITETLTHKGKGAISWERENIRARGSQYWSGIDPSLTITTNAGTEDDINFSTTNGVVFQMHRQIFPNHDISSTGIYVVNVSGDGVLTNNQKITNLNTIHEISDGTALNSGDSINIILAGGINYLGHCVLLAVLPNGKYTVDADAVNDINDTATLALPPQFKTTGFMIAKLVLKYTDTDGGTWTNLLTENVETWHTQSQAWATPNYPGNYPSSYSGYLATLTIPGAEALRVVFDNFDTEANYDYIRLRNAAETTLLSYDGILGAFTSARIDGDTIRVWFQSDGSVTRTGVNSTQFEYLTTAVGGTALIDLRGLIPLFNLN